MGSQLDQFPPEITQLTGAIIAAAIEVHRVLGPGLLESIYEEAMCVELTLRKVPFTRQRGIDLVYKGKPVGRGRLDLLVDERVVVEIKAVERLLDMHAAQVISYLRTTGLQFGLLMNFNVPVLKSGLKRFVNTGQLRGLRAAAPPR